MDTCGEVSLMARKPETPHVDLQSVNDVSAGVYEAIATLEYSGRPTSRSQIAAATRLDDDVLDEALWSMTSKGMLRTDGGDDPAYVPAQRGWSAQPDQAKGQKLS
jgi:hypothetical protein